MLLLQILTLGSIFQETVNIEIAHEDMTLVKKRLKVLFIFLNPIEHVEKKCFFMLRVIFYSATLDTQSFDSRFK